MPRETVHDQAGMYDVKVGWSRAGYVQVGVETHGGTSIATMLTETDQSEPALPPPHPDDDQPKATIGNPAPSMVSVGQTPGGLAEFTGLWGTLDRNGCNDLIRLLRKARDQAFGKDE